MFKLDNTYSDYVDTSDPKYPGGKAVDASAADMFDGTPFKAKMVDQIFGFFQAVIKEAWTSLGFDSHISGNADDVDDSDVLDAILEIIRQKEAIHAALVGSDAVHGAVATATAGAIITRDANGRAQIANPDKLAEIATREYVEKQLERTTFLAVVAATDSNITLSGEQTIDGIAVTASQLVLVKNQTDPTENGVYVCQTGAWDRSTDFDSDAEIRNKLVCVQSGTLNENRIFQVFSDEITVGTSAINFTELPLSLSGGCKKVVRKKLGACPDNRPPIGVPTMWFGDLPTDWAIDFGNGANYKYLWANYPELDNSEFRNILDKFVAAGHMNNYDAAGFYVPDLQGLVPIGYGTNAVRTGETTSGGNLAEYQGSQNKYHRHGKGDFRITGYINSIRRYAIANDNQSNGALEYNQPSGASSLTDIGLTSVTSPYRRILLDTDLNSGNGWTGNTGYNGANGQASKPATIACMWILRFI